MKLGESQAQPNSSPCQAGWERIWPLKNLAGLWLILQVRQAGITGLGFSSPSSFSVFSWNPQKSAILQGGQRETPHLLLLCVHRLFVGEKNPLVPPTTSITPRVISHSWLSTGYCSLQINASHIPKTLRSVWNPLPMLPLGGAECNVLPISRPKGRQRIARYSGQQQENRTGSKQGKCWETALQGEVGRTEGKWGLDAKNLTAAGKSST